MLLSKDVIINNVFISDRNNFLCSVMALFKSLGHTERIAPEEEYDDARFGVLQEQHRAFTFTKDENVDLAKMEMFGRLFTVEKKLFNDFRSAPVSYYAVQIRGVASNRMKIARNIHHMIARRMDNHSVILFKWFDHIMISTTCSKEEDNKIIISSEWMNRHSEDKIMRALSIENISLNSSKEFVTDIAYAIAPDYYSHPTKSYDKYYAVNNINDFYCDGLIDRENMKNYVRNTINKPINIYCDDYVDYEKLEKESSFDDVLNFEDELAMIVLQEEEELVEDLFEESYKEEASDSEDRGDYDFSILTDRDKLIAYIDG